jgi:LCP family protein required for cell wall assembly
MPRVSLASPRPVLIVGLLTIVVLVLVVSRCSSEPEVVKKPVAVISTTKPAPPPFTASGMPADLAAVIKPLYFGGKVPSARSATKVLSKRTPVKAGGRVVVRGSVSTWKGAPIAVVTRGKDVTLAVKAPRWKVVGGWWPSLKAGTPSLGGGPRRVLVVGSDARKGQPAERSRGDSLHIVGYDGHGGGGIVGIARDSYVPLASGGRGKINSALVFGGPASLQRTVTSATGVPLDGYLVTGFAGFRKLINGVGGLPVNAPVAIKDKDAQANIKAGPQKLSGAEALAYSRARHTVVGGDFGRSVNQGRLIQAAGGLTKTAGPLRLPQLLHTVGGAVGTNLSAEQVLTFAAGAYVTNPKKVKNKIAAGGFGMTSDGQSIVVLNAQARRLFVDIRDGNLK